MFYSKKFSISIALLALILLIGVGLVNNSAAQNNDSSWSDPLNLSMSGSATQPRIVVDSKGGIDLLWLDEFKGAIAMQSVDGQWSAPVKITMAPFVENFPSLKVVGGPDGLIHAAWLDDKGGLYYSKTDVDNFTSPSGWAPAKLVALSIAGFDLTAAPNGNAHIAFARSDEFVDFPAGIYTIRIAKGWGAFTTPHLLYASPYLRGLKPGQIQVGVAASQSDAVFVAWDEQPLEQVAMAVSSDNGDTWGEPQVIDRRQPTDGTGQGPSRPWLGAQGEQVWLVWQAGHQGQACGQYYQASADAGASWSESQALPVPLDSRCGKNLQLLHSPQAGTYLMADTPNGIQLLTWGGDPTPGWSAAQLQGDLFGFIHPETYRPVTLGCWRGALQGEDLLVVGCEGEGAGDIWLQKRLLGDPASWFPTQTPIPIWGTPDVLDSSLQAIHSLLLIGEPSGRLHTFWTYQDSPEIEYSLWDGSRWTMPEAMLSSPGGIPQGITAALNPGGQMLVAWADSTDGALYYSQVPATQAIDAATWSAPLELPIPGAAAAPQALALQDGRMMVAYAVPYNERRGIYLVESKAAPQTGQKLEWSQPQAVFDAAAAGWDSLSDPRPALDSAGGLHMLWTRYNLPPNGKATGLYIAHSSQGGSWTVPELVYEGEVVWSQLLAAPDGTMHRAWQGILGKQAVLFHQYSTTNSTNWSEVVRVGGSARTDGLAGMAFDEGGRLNLLLLNENTGFSGGSDDEAAPLLQHWGWQGDTWQAAESQVLDELRAPAALSVAAPSASLAALYSGEYILQGSQSSPQGLNSALKPTPEAQYGLFISGRPLDNPPLASAAAPTLTPSYENGLHQTETPTPAGPQPTPTFAVQAPSGLSSSLGGQSGTLILGAIPAVLLVIGAFILLSRRSQRQK